MAGILKCGLGLSFGYYLGPEPNDGTDHVRNVSFAFTKFSKKHFLCIQNTDFMIILTFTWQEHEQRDHEMHFFREFHDLHEDHDEEDGGHKHRHLSDKTRNTPRQRARSSQIVPLDQLEEIKETNKKNEDIMVKEKTTPKKSDDPVELSQCKS